MALPDFSNILQDWSLKIPDVVVGEIMTNLRTQRPEYIAILDGTLDTPDVEFRRVLILETAVSHLSVQDFRVLRVVPLPFLGHARILNAILSRYIETDHHAKIIRKIMSHLFSEAVPHFIDQNDQQVIDKFLQNRMTEFGCISVSPFTSRSIQPFLSTLMKTQSCYSDTDFLKALEKSCCIHPDETIVWIIDFAVKFPSIINSVAQVLKNELKPVVSHVDELHPDSLFGAAISFMVLTCMPEEVTPDLLWHKINAVVQLLHHVIDGNQECISYGKVISSIVSSVEGTWNYEECIATLMLLQVLEEEGLFGHVDWNQVHFGNLMTFFVYVIIYHVLNPMAKQKIIGLIGRIFSRSRRIAQEDLDSVKSRFSDKDYYPLLGYFAPYLHPDLDFIRAVIPFAGLNQYMILMLSCIFETGSVSYKSLILKVLQVGPIGSRLQGILKFATKEEMRRMFSFMSNYYSTLFMGVTYVKTLWEMKKIQEDLNGEIGVFGFHAGINWSHLIPCLDYTIRQQLLSFNQNFSNKPDALFRNHVNPYMVKELSNKDQSNLGFYHYGWFHLLLYLTRLTVRFSQPKFVAEEKILFSLIRDVLAKKTQICRGYYYYPEEWESLPSYMQEFLIENDVKLRRYVAQKEKLKTQSTHQKQQDVRTIIKI